MYYRSCHFTIFTPLFTSLLNSITGFVSVVDVSQLASSFHHKPSKARFSMETFTVVRDIYTTLSLEKVQKNKNLIFFNIFVSVDFLSIILYN